MSRKHLAALAIALALLSEPVAAELRGSPEGPPVFTAAEVAVITRNAVLSALIQDNPWAVRRVLDALAAVSTTPSNGSKRAVGSAAPADATIDPLANPDLDQLQRVSPEALLDLFSRDSPDEPRTDVDGSDLLDWPEAQVRGVDGSGIPDCPNGVKSLI